jgi:hypothetical protein
VNNPEHPVFSTTAQTRDAGQVWTISEANALEFPRGWFRWIARRAGLSGPQWRTQAMAKVEVGEKVKVRHNDDFTYTLDVEVTATCPFNEFIGRVERVFSGGGGEMTGGNILALKGQEKKFRNDDILYPAH